VEKELALLKEKLRSAERYCAKLEKSTLISRQLLKNTIQVKLRYGKIIETLIDEEKAEKRRSVSQVIADTPITEVDRLKCLDQPLPECMMRTKTPAELAREAHSPNEPSRVGGKKRNDSFANQSSRSSFYRFSSSP